MGLIGQIYYNVLDSLQGLFISSLTIDIFDKNIVTLFRNNENMYFTKVGVQAPPGTLIVFNGNKNVIVGRTGVYDLDDVKVTSMLFIRPILYTLDEGATNDKLKDGIAALRDAWLYWKNNIAGLSLDYSGTIDTTIAKTKQTVYQTYRTNMEQYNKAYTTALAIFNLGDYGIYKVDKTKKADLYNVIIDFIYET